jgi:4-hydroxy-3-methylbut-2-enyl diphosphate reductase
MISSGRCDAAFGERGLISSDRPASMPEPQIEDLPVSKDGIVRRGFGLKAEILGQLSEDYHSEIIARIRAEGNVWRAGGIVFRLANHFGFCYGVDKAIDFAYETRKRFPARRIFLTAEIIHNPRVNRRMAEMGIGFLSGQYADGMTIDRIEPEDVVLLPAFGVSNQLLARLKEIGCILVDTTCGSVIHVWKRVEKYTADGFTSIIHGKWRHEETVATVSHSETGGGHCLVLLTKEDAALACDFIRAGAPEQLVPELEARFRESKSPDFDFRRDLQRIGIANQTTMLSSESLEIAGMFRQAMIDRYGEGEIDKHFRSFDTICNATQERQDAVMVMMKEPPDLMLIVGGFNSSNTTHLAEMTIKHCPTYHIDEVGRLRSPREIEHRPAEGHGELEVARDWLPARRPLTVGLTAGASTPNRVIGEVIERLAGWESAGEPVS